MFFDPLTVYRVSTIRKLVSQTAIYGLSQIVGRFVNYLLVPLHTALFAATDYGVNGLMYAFVTFFNVLLTYGMETAFFRFSQKSERPENVYRTAVTSLLYSSISFGILLTLLSQPVASLIGVPMHPEYVIYFAWIIAIDAFCALPFAYLRQHNKAVKFAIVKNINIFANIILNLYFLVLCPWVHQHYNLLLPLYNGQIELGFIFMANLIASLITLPLLFTEVAAMKHGAFDKKLWKEMLTYALPIMVIGFAGMINETLDRLIISYTYPTVDEGLAANGIYNANYKLSIIMTLFIQAFRYAAEPFFFNHAKQSDKRTIYAEVMNYFVAVCCLVFLVVSLYLDVFKHFINYRYWEGLHVVPILLIANIFLGMYYNLSIWYKLSDQTAKGATISLIGAGITIVFNFLLVPFLGYTGAAWATLICYASMVAICYYQGTRYYPIPYQPIRFVSYILVAIGIYLLYTYIDITTIPLLQYGLNGIIILAYVVVVFWFERRNKIVNSPE
ncbi:MAG: oligosaccharide flippase family protein [Bacteroidia bacterium]|jgi:O-antigen/teichoic acid export membrane protein|nr:oligosaccharide flippase family protein [Bacteroidia bacterium]